METEGRPLRIRVLMILLLLIILIVAGYLWLPVGRLIHRSSLDEKEFAVQEILNAAPNSVSFNFEPLPGTGTPKGLYKGIAHSGEFSAKVFGMNSYSPAIERKVSETGPGELKAVGVSAWVYIFPTKADITSDLILGISNKLGVNVIWKKVIVEGTRLPMGKWFKVSGFFDLADKEIKPDYRLQLFYWNNSKADILVDDFYMVFGTSSERRGDSALVDMTQQKPFSQRANHPPYPFIFAERAEIGNHNSPFLVDDGKIKEGMISPGDRIFTGNFTGDKSGLDQLLVLNPGKKPELFYFSSEKGAFRKVEVLMGKELATLPDAPVVLSGRFSSVTATEILFISGREIILAGFSPMTADHKTILNLVRKATVHLPVDKSFQLHFLSVDLNGDRMSELFAAEPNGKWHLFKYWDTGWEDMSSAADKTVTDWMAGMGKITFYAGEFISMKSWSETILAVCETDTPRTVRYSVHRLDPVTGQFKSLFRDHQDLEKTLQDLPSTSDLFFSTEADQAGPFLKYKRDWRYDLKLVSFDQSGFRVLGNVDFKGYALDRNPKYFENLKILTGCFLTPGKTSFMVIGCNCKRMDSTTGKCLEYINRPELPNSIQVYSLVPITSEK